MSDVYQDRYIAHQAKKKEQLMFSKGEKPKKITDPIKQRRSQRIFTSTPLDEKIVTKILTAATYAPSSCNRHGIKLKVITDRTEKNLLNGILVGGVGWCYRAHAIILLIADPQAYKSPNEKDFMHYCDAGFTAMTMWLTAESLGVGACYINPNIMPENKALFASRFGEGIFCGALAIGNYDIRVTEADHPTLAEIMI